MTIDERLDRLTERHEALTQTVELVAHMQQENEKAMAKTQARLAEVGEHVELLARVALSHDRRITGLEGG